jgi:gliding motility-associated-like protein
VQSADFQTTNQNLWGPGSGGAGIDINYPFFDWGWNTGGNYGGISEFMGYYFGVNLSASTWGSIGAGLTLDIGNELVSVNYETDVNLQMPKANSFNKGQEVTISTGYTPQMPGSYIAYDEYDFLFRLWLKFGMGVHLNGQACFFNCTNFSLINLEMPVDTFSLISVSPTNITLLDGLYNPPILEQWNETGMFTYTDDKDIMTLTIQLPTNGDSTLYMVGNTLYARSTPFEYASVTFDIPKFIGALNIPYVSAFFGNLSNSWNIGPLEIWYTLLKTGFALRLYHNQLLTFSPTMYTEMTFPTSVDYKILNASNTIIAQGSGATVNTQVGNKVRFRYPCNYDFMNISARYSITNQFRNHTYDSLAFNFSLEMLGFGISMPDVEIIPEICVPIYEPCGPWYCYICDWCYCCELCTPAVVFPGFSWGGGPLLDYEWNLFNISYDWLNSSWSLGGFNTVQGAPFKLKPKPYSVAATATPVLCFGNSTGTATATVTNGTPPYRYEWSNNVTHTSSLTSDNVSNLPAGTQYVMVTDVNNCQVFNDVVIAQPAMALALSSSVTNVLCNGQNTGSINLSTIGGTTPYSYTWNSGPSTQNLSSIPAGNYTVTVSDNNGCTSTQSYNVTQPTAMVLTPATTPLNCNGDGSGSVSIAAGGGVSPYSYNWSNGPSTASQTGLAAGSYTVTVTDFNGCQQSQSLTVTQPAQPVSLSFTTQNVLCYGSASGNIQLSPAGGTGAYQTTWYDPSGVLINQTGTALNGITAGTYSAIIRDQNGCAIDTVIPITQPPVISWTSNYIDNLCFGESNGSLSIAVSGGTPGYNYTWSNGGSGTALNSLPAGVYSVTITDNNACVATTSITISQPASAVMASVAALPVRCFGENTGVADLSPVGGTPPYTFNWSDGSSTEDLSNLPAGAYTVTVTDNNGCLAYSGTVIKQPADSLALQLNINDVSCYGGNNGSISVNASGGTTPYYLRWDNTDYMFSNTGHLVNNLSTGTYEVIVTDANGCTNQRTITITAPAALSLDALSSITHCFGGSDGSIDLTVAGGAIPYTFHWSNGSSSEDIAGLTAGTYSVTVTDNHLCSNSASYVVNTNPEIVLTPLIKPISCVDNTDGSISVTPSGGDGNINYSWADGSTGNSLSNLAPGNYSVTVTDGLGCTRTYQFNVPSSEFECMFIPTSFTPNGDGINDTWVVRNINLYPGNSVKIYNRWGNLLYEASPYETEWDGTYKGDPVPAETYYYIINLNNGTAAFTGNVTIIR